MAGAALTHPRRRRVAILATRLAAAAIALAAAGPLAVADAQRPSGGSRLLWATVNVCDSQRWPDTIGIRGSMPGSKDGREAMWMRFQVQFLAADGTWQDVPAGGDSGFFYVGPARPRARQAGRSFRVSPKKGERVLLRGRVSFEWRLKGEVVRRASERTRKGHRSSAGSDPPGYTAATCTITGDP
jgi:hypothetical protein